ncbi:MAG: asparagine synthase C-terminal domain-containing protein [Proteobacteria bacterium]|nr:asparagine synthase C-terminal domain-containing protein [Pseudomonadota bacterium]
MGSLFGFSGPPDIGLLGRIDQVLRHRGGPDLFADESDGGSVGCRPMSGTGAGLGRCEGLCRDGETALALVGYLTNRAELDQPLLPGLLEMYRRQGPAFVQNLRGAFILAVRDGLTWHLFRDGAGARTVYFGRHEGRFVFAVEPKGVLAMPGFPRRLRPGAVAQYLTFSFIPGPGTMLEDLAELPAGHRVMVREGGPPEVSRYFRFEDLDKEERSDGEWIEEFRLRFSRAVAERLPETEPLACFLSGGIDSSIVAAEAARRHRRTVRTFSIHFGPDYPNELEFARAVAQRVGTEHEEVEIRPHDFLPRLRRIIWHLDDPIGDPITVPNFELSARVSRDLSWVINGEGGDPLFGGPKNIPMLLHHWYGGIDPEPAFRERMYLASYRRCYDDLDRMLTPEWRSRYDPGEDLIGILTPFFEAPKPLTFLDKLQAINIRLKGAHLILPKVDRMTGAWGLRQLAPLFDERLIELSFCMPPRLKLRRGVEKYVLKRAYDQDLPPEIIARPKSGMRVPVHFWFKGELKKYARHILSPKKIRRVGIFEPERVRQLLDYDVEEGPGRYGLRLWMLVTFEVWRRIVIEGEAP